MPAIRIVIACQALTAEGLQQLLREHFEIVGVASRRPDAVQMTVALEPIVLLMDADFADPDGIDVLQQIRTGAPKVRIVLLSRKTQGLALRRALSMGVVGLISLQQSSRELCDALRTVSRGEVYIATALRNAFFWIQGTQSSLRREQRSSLTPRQQQVLQLVAEGRTNREMAALLHLSVKTVEFHRSVMMRELGLRTVAELSRYAMHNGMVGPTN